MACKISNGLVILEPNMLPKVNFQRPMRQCNEAKAGKSNQLMEPHPGLDITASTFFFSTPKIWNKIITPLQANTPSVEAFQKHFKK